MTLSSSPLPLSSLGETCISYFDSITANLPVSLRSLPDRFVNLASRSANLEPTWSLPPFSRVLSSEEGSTVAFPPTAVTAIIFTVAACVLAIVAMSWHQPFTNLWRRSPYNSIPSPQVGDGDYSYLTRDDIGESNRRYDAPDDSAPDTIFLKHLRHQYELHFPAYAIDDGLLTVGQLRQRAAEVTGTADARRVKLLYKGKLLKDDSRPCREEGLKQDSVVMAVLHAQANDATSSEASGSEAERTTTQSTRHDDDQDAQQNHGGERKKKKRNKKKNKKNQRQEQQPDSNNPAPPTNQQPSPSGSSALPPPSPNIKNMSSPLQQAEALSDYLRNTLVPLSNAFIANPPTEPKAREYEFKKLSETILAQVLLKADSIEPDGNVDARNARRTLVKEAQATLSKLDEAVKA